MVKGRVFHVSMCCLAALTLFLAACEHKDLCYDHPHGQAVRVVFNWNKIKRIPASMRLFFYPLGKERTEPYMYDVGSAFLHSGIGVELPTGRYRVVSFNVDTENIFVRTEQNFSDMELYTLRRTLTLTAGQDGKSVTGSIPVVDTPEWICRAVATEIEIIQNEEGTEQIVELTPHPAVSRFSYKIKGIKNANRVKNIIGTLSGVAGSLFAGTGAFPQNTSTVHFEAHLEGDVVTGEFNVFGINTASLPRDKNLFTLYFRTATGVFHHTFDVTDRIWVVEENNQYVINAYIDIDTEVEIPEPLDGGGMQVDVEQWEEIIKDVNV